MENNLFSPSSIGKQFFVDAVAPTKRGKTFSITKMFNADALGAFGITDAKVHDANFAFLTTTLAKLHTKLYEPLVHVTYPKDIQVDTGGGFVDYVSYYTVEWAGIMNEFRNVMGNNANYIPRVNAGLSQHKVNVYTWEVAYDLRFVELEKMKNVQISKSIQDIYRDVIVAGWDLFCQKVVYEGIGAGKGLFNQEGTVKITTIPNSGTTGRGFEGLSDAEVVAFFNGVFQYYLANSGRNPIVLPDTFLVPDYVGADLTGRMSALYTSTLRKFILEHNLASDETDGELKLSIRSRTQLNDLGTAGKGRIVAYRNDRSFLRVDMPYPMQHYITLPNIDKMSYTSAFVGQISDIQMPYNTNDSDLGPITYWDFTD